MVKKPDREPSGPPPREGEARIRDVTARGIRTRVLEAGSERAPALLLLHGLFASHRSFEDVIEDLGARFHVIAPDFPGFGESEKPSPARYAYGVEAHAESVADLIAAFGVGRAHVLGHDMGGAAALTLAAEHPELVQRLVLEDAVAYPFVQGFKARLPLVPVLGGFVFKQLYGRALFRALFRDTYYRPDFEPPFDRVDWHYDVFNSPSARESAHAMMRALLDTRPVVARLSRITAPTLVLWGRDDALCPVPSAHKLAREIPRAKLEIMDAGHTPHEERPRELVMLVTEFLEGKR
jgi:pimeloyl-ACP methyl ester carboxylesterase